MTKGIKLFLGDFDVWFKLDICLTISSSKNHQPASSSSLLIFILAVASFSNIQRPVLSDYYVLLYKP